MGLFDWLTGGTESTGDAEPAATAGPRESAAESESGSVTGSGRFRVAVDDVFAVGGTTVASGRVEAGRIEPGAAVEVRGRPLEGRVRTVERHHESVDAATEGDHVGLELAGVDTGELAAGDVLRPPG